MTDLSIGVAGQLNGNQTDRQRLRQAAEQFEALFVREMLKTSRESALRDEDESPALKQFEQLLHEGIAEHAAGGFGVADMLERALLERQGTAVKPEATEQLSQQSAQPAGLNQSQTRAALQAHAHGAEGVEL